MKNTLQLFLATVAIAGLASAGTVSCTITPSGPLSAYTTGVDPFANTAFLINNGESGGTINNSINCPTVNAGAGNIITSYSAIATGDYTGGPIGTTTGTQVNLVFGTLGSAPVGASTLLLMVTGGNSSSGFVPATPFQIGAAITPNTQTVAGFNVSVSSTTISGSVAASSGQVVLNYTTSSATPEPATLAMTGSVLLGLGFLGRRKK